MQIFATFEYSAFLEMAITELEKKGITAIYAVPLDPRKEMPRFMDSLHRADGMSFMDKGMILAFIFGTVGASRGFAMSWGPIVWGIIGAASGFVLGLSINWITYLLHKRRKRRPKMKRGNCDVILIVTCEDNRSDQVEHILWDHQALGLARTT